MKIKKQLNIDNMKSRQSSKRKTRNANSPQKEEVPDIMFYGYGDVLRKENKMLFALLRENLGNLNFIKKINRHIRFNKKEIEGITFAEKHSGSIFAASKTKVRLKKEELENEIVLLKKAQKMYDSEAMLQLIDDYIFEKKSFILGFDSYKEKAGVVFNTEKDLNFYLDETIEQEAIENLVKKGFLKAS